MMNRFSTLVVLATLLVSVSAEARFDRFGIVVTNDTYERCNAIPYTQNDGDAMEAFLRQIPNLTKNGKIIRKRNADLQWFNAWFGTSKSSEGYLQGYLSKSPKEVWIYYSGHGGTDGKETYILPVDLNPDQMENSSYPLDTLVANLKTLGIPRVYLIIDACYGGQSAEGNVRKDGKPFDRAQQVPDTVVSTIPAGFMLMQSCRGNQISWDYGASMSLFTYSLLKNWWGMQSNKQIQADTLLKSTTKFIAGYCVDQDPPKPLQEPWFSDTSVKLPVPRKKGDLSKWAKAPTKPRKVVSHGLSGQAYKPIVDHRTVPELPFQGENPPTVRKEGTWPQAFSRSQARQGIAFSYFGTDDGGIAKYRWKLNDDDSQETVGLRVTLDNLPAGYHTLQVQAIDYDGATSKPIKHQFLVRGNEPPVAKLLSPTGDTARGKTLSIKVGGTDPDGKITTYRAAVGSTKNLQSNTKGSLECKCAGGSQKIYAQVVDDEGAVSDWVETRVDYTFDEGFSGGGGVYTLPGGVKLEMVSIEPGTFWMGSPPDEPGRDSDEDRHRVKLTKGFEIGKYEVTQGQWKAIMGSNPSQFSSCGSDCPVESVSWDDCHTFIRKLNQQVDGGGFRLPTEAEWEYTCRAGTTSAFSTGACLSTSQANYDGNYPQKGCSKGTYREKTVSVGSFSPNARSEEHTSELQSH